MLGTHVPHALLFAGPAGVGKTTLALDLAMARLCVGATGAQRPCRACRSCRMVEHGNHPDLHRLVPSGAGSTISIGGRDDRGVRDLVRDLSLLPVEGGARVAIVESASRMTEDAQSALLKTLEEPPADTTLILCADEEERLLPTIRSRVARVRLGPIGIRDIEAILVELGAADAPTAARLARLTDGRPGHALAFARAPEAATIRDMIGRTLLDLRSGGLTGRLAGVRELAGQAAAMLEALDTGARAAGDAERPTSTSGTRGRRRGRVSAASSDAAGPASDDRQGESGATTRAPAAERRRAAVALVDIWRTVVRDLGLVAAGERARVRALDLLEDLDAIAAAVDLAAVGEDLARLERAAEQLEGNVSPELVLDDLAAWWGRRRAA